MRLRMIIGRRLQCPQIHKKLNRTKKLKQKDLNTYTKNIKLNKYYETKLHK